MRTGVTVVAASLLILLAGCAGVQHAPMPPDVLAAATVTKSTEQDGRFISLVGPRRPHAEPFLGVVDTNFDLLRSWIDTRTGETVHQLYVESSYFGAERNWEAARLQPGPALRFISISKNKITCDSGCSYAEEFAATLPEALLRSSPRGLAVSFTARSGAEQTILVPGELIARQLAAVNATRAALPVAAAAPPR